MLKVKQKNSSNLCSFDGGPFLQISIRAIAVDRCAIAANMCGRRGAVCIALLRVARISIAALEIGVVEKVAEQQEIGEIDGK